MIYTMKSLENLHETWEINLRSQSHFPGWIPRLEAHQRDFNISFPVYSTAATTTVRSQFYATWIRKFRPFRSFVVRLIDYLIQYLEELLEVIGNTISNNGGKSVKVETVVPQSRRGVRFTKDQHNNGPQTHPVIII